MPKRKTVKVIFIVAVILIIMTFVLRQIIIFNEQRSEFENKTYNALVDFDTVEEVAKYLDCELIKQEKSTNANYTTDIYLKFKYDLYTDGASNQDYFYTAALLFGQVVYFENIRLIDEEKDILIALIGDRVNRKLANVYINGRTNYYGEQDTMKALENYKSLASSKMDIKSKVLKDLIKMDWSTTEVDFGSQESTFDGYDIYFDEGIELKKVGTKVFNIVFTEKYEDDIVNGLKVNTEFDKIIANLGNPSFGKADSNMIGFKGDDIYIFFEEDRVSVYPVYKVDDEQQFLTLVENYRQNKDLKKFVTGITDLWQDYDKFDYDEEHVDLQYTLRGLKIQYNVDRDSGVIFYSNYGGSYIGDLRANKNNLPKYTYFVDEDLVYKYEYEIIYDGVHDYKYALRMYNYAKDQTIEHELENIERYKYDSNKFFVAYTDKKDKLKIISINREYPPSETEENVNSFFWIDDSTLAYSIKNKGIYLYNAETMEKSVLIEGTNEFNIITYQNGILFYDNTYIMYGLQKEGMTSYLWLNNSIIIY